MSDGAKDKRVQLRLDADADAKIRAAADATHQGNRTAFITEAALIHADRVLANRTQFDLPASRWAALVEALDAAPVYNESLDQLINRKSGFETGA